MTKSSIKWQLVRMSETPSTNKALLQAAHEGRAVEGTVLIADSQTHGRGQGSNSWESAPGKNLTFSILIEPSFIKPSEQFAISQAAALAVHSFVTAAMANARPPQTSNLKLQTPNSVTVKWPNDIYVGSRKIAGILIEHVIEGLSIKRSIIGIGLNINQERFVSDAPNPVSLLQLTGQSFDLAESLQQVLGKLAILYGKLQDEGTEALNADYLSHLYRFREWHEYKAGEQLFEGFIAGVTPHGQLIVGTRDGREEVFAFKEIEFVH